MDLHLRPERAGATGAHKSKSGRDEIIAHSAQRPRHFVAIGIAVLSTSTAAILAKECASPPAVTALYRMALTSGLVLPFVLLGPRPYFGDFRPRTLLISLLAGVFLGAHYVTWFSSLKFTSVASSVVLVSIHPLVVALLSGKVTRDRVSWKAILAIGVSLVGACLVGIGDFDVSKSHFLGDLLAVLGGVLAAFYFLTGRVLRKSLSLFPYMFVVYGAATLTILSYCFARSLPLTGFTRETYLYFFLLAAIPTLIGHSLLNWTLRYVKAHIVSLSQLGEPLGATVLAFVLLGEVPGVFFYPAAVLILGGIFLLLSVERDPGES